MDRMIRREDGSVVITALAMVTLMLVISFSAIAFVDSTQRESGRERKRESTFVLSEGVLNTQIFLLSRQWPGQAVGQYPYQCTKLNASDPRCPDDPRLATSFRGPDYNGGITWTTEIRDNPIGSVDYYDETVMANATIPRWDANKDSYLWVRAQGILANGKRRTLVALVKAEELAVNFPRQAVVAGSIDITQNGNHSYISSSDIETGEAGAVVVRCSPPTSQGCAEEKKDIHISPAEVQSNPAMANAMNARTIELLRDQARSAGTYYPAGGPCPPSSALAGQIVFMERPNNCVFGDTGAIYNTRPNPGVLIIGSGKITFDHGTYNGLVYHVNGSDGVGAPVPAGTAAVTLKSNSAIVGQLIIDGSGRLEMGNNNGGPGLPGNIVYMGRARNNLKAFGTAGIVQNSFREIQAKR